MKLNFKVKIIFDAKGKKTGVLISIKEFERLIQELEDLKDLAVAYERTSKAFKPIPYDQIRKELFGDDAKK